MKHPHIPAGCDQQGRIRAAGGLQMQRLAESRDCPQTRDLFALLVARESITGPHKAAHPVCWGPLRRWYAALWRFITAPMA